jgi:hypothetical protein
VKNNGNCLKQQALCPYDIFPLETERVQELHILLCNLEKRAYAKIDEMEGEKKWLVEKLIGLKFSMED